MGVLCLKASQAGLLGGLESPGEKQARRGDGPEDGNGAAGAFAFRCRCGAERGRGKSPGDGKGSSALGNGGPESAQPVAEKMEGEVEERVSGA